MLYVYCTLRESCPTFAVAERCFEVITMRGRTYVDNHVSVALKIHVHICMVAKAVINFSTNSVKPVITIAKFGVGVLQRYTVILAIRMFPKYAELFKKERREA